MVAGAGVVATRRSSRSGWSVSGPLSACWRFA